MVVSLFTSISDKFLMPTFVNSEANQAGVQTWQATFCVTIGICTQKHKYAMRMNTKTENSNSITEKSVYSIQIFVVALYSEYLIQCEGDLGLQ